MDEIVTYNTRDRQVYLLQSTSENESRARLKRIKYINKVIKALSVSLFKVFSK